MVLPKTRKNTAKTPAAATVPMEYNNNAFDGRLQGDDNGGSCSPKIMVILSPAKTLDLSPLARDHEVMVAAARKEGLRRQEHHHHQQQQPPPPQPLPPSQPDSCGHPCKTRAIAEAMKRKKEDELMKLLGISKALAIQSAQYWSDFEVIDQHQNKNDSTTTMELDRAADEGGMTRNGKKHDDHVQNGISIVGKPCVFLFSGPAYQGLNVATCTLEELRWLQDSLRIIDPVYGLLRPLDVVQPYRLEMGTKGLCLASKDDDDAENDDDANRVTIKPSKPKPVKLADYWKGAVTTRLVQELTLGESLSSRQRKHQQNSQTSLFAKIPGDSSSSSSARGILLNLASDEYAAAVDSSQLEAAAGDRAILAKVVFWEQSRVVAVHAKRARGLLTRFLARVQATNLDQVREFQEEGYRFVTSKSDNTTLVFDRNKDWKSQATNTSRNLIHDSQPVSDSKATTPGRRTPTTRKRKQISKL